MEPGKLLQRSVMTEEFGERVPQGSQAVGDSEMTWSCGLEAEPDLLKIGKEGARSRKGNRPFAFLLICHPERGVQSKDRTNKAPYE